MTLWLHVHGGYPSYGQSGEGWGGLDWDAYKFVQALKGKAFKGYADLPKPDGTWVRITVANRAGAFDLFGQWGAKKLNELGIGNALLVPVPASDCVALGTDQKGMALAEAIAKYHPGCTPVSGLHWAEPLQKASAGGTRNANTLFEVLRVKTDMPKDPPVILIDDVASTGGHLLACARGLRHFGHTVEHAVCAAQTVNTHPEKMFEIAARDLEHNPFEGMF